MKTHPILFNGAMVRALLDGNKTQTRRVLKMPHGLWETAQNGRLVPIPAGCPYGQPGDQLWVRESISYDAEWGHKWADGEFLCEVFGDAYSEDDTLPDRGIPSIHVPRRYSRITLEIVSVRVERLQDISEADAAAEGWTRHPEVSDDPDVHTDAARDWYTDLWESINGPDSWSVNPWVWVVEFRRLP